MKNKRILFLAVFSVSLSGCANLQQLDSTLTQIKNVASQQGTGVITQAATVPVGQLGDGTGFQPQFNITVPANTCSQQPYIDGFKDQYVSSWDQFIMVHSSDPGSGYIAGHEKEHARANYYQAHFIGMGNYMQHNAEARPDVTGTNRAQGCIYSSYIAGQAAGGEAAQTNESLLFSTEPK
jgi:hypothetical protein